MKYLTLIACIAACGGASARVAPPTGCFPAAGADAPLVALYELNPVAGTSFPSVAIWPDGEVMGEHPEYGASTAGAGHLEPARAAQIAAAVRADLAGVPDHSSVSTATDEPLTRVIVREGNTWRVVAVYGFTGGSKEPAGMVAAVKRLKDVRDALSAKWFPLKWELTYDEYVPPAPDLSDGKPPAQEEMRPWPEGLPVPDSTGQRIVIDAKLYPLVDGLDNHPALRDGKAWRVDARALVRGEQVIEDVQRCALRR